MFQMEVLYMLTNFINIIWNIVNHCMLIFSCCIQWLLICTLQLNKLLSFCIKKIVVIHTLHICYTKLFYHNGIIKSLPSNICPPLLT